MLPDAASSHPQKWIWLRSVLVPAIAVVLLIAAMAKWFEWSPGFLSVSRNAVFRIENGAWKPLPNLPGDAEKVRVSNTGAVWALVWHYGIGHELARLDGPAWKAYGAKDFGARSSVYVSAGFALDGDEVWAGTFEHLLHWDGRRWISFRFPAQISDPCSLVAANGAVWLIDGRGNLAHFDGRGWSVRKIELPRVKWNEDDHDPALARTRDGSLWIIYKGAWRSDDGLTWAEVKAGGELVGITGARIWLWDGKVLTALTRDGTADAFTPAAMGLAQGEDVSQVSESAGRIYAATDAHILELDASIWKPVASLRRGVDAVAGLAVDPNGGVLAIGTVPKPEVLRWQWLRQAVPLAFCLALLAVPIWAVRDYKRRQLREHQRLQQVVAHATGAVPEEFARDERLLAKQSSWWSAILAVGVIAGAGVGYWVTRFFWPAAPAWTFLVIALALHILVTLGQSLIRKTPKPWDPIEPGGPAFDWGPTRRALPGSLAVFLLMNVGHLPRWMGDPVRWVLYSALAVAWYKVIEAKLVARAVRRADYDGALKIVSWFHFYDPEGGSALMRRGHMLLLAGRFHQAEDALRAAVARLRSHGEQAHALEQLGDALLEQGRDDEALRAYEAALNAAPGFRRPYRGMAEAVLRRGGHAARALEYIEKIVGPSGPSWNKWTINGNPTDDYWALKAWALAELGRSSEVPAAVVEALRHTNPKSCPEMAVTCRRLGLAMQAMGRAAEAKEYFDKARNADPSGRWGRLAGYSGLSRMPTGLPRGTSVSSRMPPASVSASNISSSSISSR